MPHSGKGKVVYIWNSMPLLTKNLLEDVAKEMDGLRIEYVDDKEICLHYKNIGSYIIKLMGFLDSKECLSKNIKEEMLKLFPLIFGSEVENNE